MCNIQEFWTIFFRFLSNGLARGLIGFVNNVDGVLVSSCRGFAPFHGGELIRGAADIVMSRA